MKSYVFPGDIEESIRQIAAQPIPYMRTTDFSRIVKECEEMLLHLISCSNGKIIPYTASGTGAMDAVVQNYVSSLNGKAFIIIGGSFGHRWQNICQYYKISYDVFNVDFAKDIDYNNLEKSIIASKPKVLLCQQHETSTGELYDINKISKICHKYNIRLIVDAISSFLADPLDMDALDIDICITSSQKGLNISPGLSFIFLSHKLGNNIFDNNGFYFDFSENLKNLRRGQTPYSPATTLFLQLHERLSRDIKIGTTNIINSVHDKAVYFRKLCKENNWDTPVEIKSNCITGFFVKKNGDYVFTELMKKGIYIMPGATKNYFRVSHLGLQTPEELDNLARAIKDIENENF